MHVRRLEEARAQDAVIGAKRLTAMRPMLKGALAVGRLGQAASGGLAASQPDAS